MTSKQTTINRSVSISGTGIHTGQLSTLTFHPAEINTGISFKRVNDEVSFRPDSSLISDTSRGTTITYQNRVFHTVEHVLSALSGMAIDNCLVEFSAEEPPIMDGSALAFVRLLEQAGIIEQNATKPEALSLTKTLVLQDDDKCIVGYPYPGLKITYNLDYPDSWLTKKSVTVDVEPSVFRSEVAQARTFCFEHEIEWLRDNGLAKGGTLENAIVLTKDGIKNGPLRHDEELVLHKILDFIGDLALLGNTVNGHFVATKSGHAMNAKLVDYLKTIQKQNKGGKQQVIVEAQEIEKLLPHRYPFLLIDRVVELVENEKVVGIKNVTINEPFFQGHFPGHPIMPGVLIVEAMAQCGGILVMKGSAEAQSKLVYFTSIDNVKFRKPVIPGDQLRFELTFGRIKGRMLKMHGQAFVEDKLVCEADLMCALVDK